MKTLFKFAGIVACVAALGLNLQYAMDGYGIKSGSLYLNVFAADSGSSGSTESSGGSVEICSTKLVKSIFTDPQDCYVTLNDGTIQKVTRYKKGEHVYQCEGYNPSGICYNGSVFAVYDCSSSLVSTDDQRLRVFCPKL